MTEPGMAERPSDTRSAQAADRAAKLILALLEQPTDDRRPLVNRLRREASVNDLTQAVRFAKKPLTKQILIDILGNRHAKSAVPALIEALSDEDEKVRFAAADAIGKVYLSDHSQRQKLRLEAGEALHHAFQNERSSGVKEMLVSALGALRYEPALPEIRAALDDPDIGLQEAARWSIDRFSNGEEQTEAVPILRTGRPANPRVFISHRAADVGKSVRQVQEALRAMQVTPDFVQQAIRASQTTPESIRLMQQALRHARVDASVIRDAARSTRVASNAFLATQEALRAMQVAPDFVQQAIRASQITPNTFRLMEQAIRSFDVNPSILQDAIRSAQTTPSTLGAAQEAIQSIEDMAALRDAIHRVTRVRNQLVHGDVLATAVANFGQTVNEARLEGAEDEISEQEVVALQAITRFLLIYMALTLVAREWRRRVGEAIDQAELFLASLVVWQESAGP
jgi:hypothetical protein